MCPFTFLANKRIVWWTGILLSLGLNSCALASDKEQASKNASRTIECSKKITSEALFKDHAPSVVVVKARNSQGSGFIVRHDEKYTYIATNAHVVASYKWATVKWFNDEESVPDTSQGYGEVIGNLGGLDYSSDLALVRVKRKHLPPVKFSLEPPSVGEDVVVIGSPSGLEFSLTKGVVSQLRNKGDYVQVDASINPGNSGGPVFNDSGCVIGMATFKLAKGNEGIAFAISSPIISSFLKNPKYFGDKALKAVVLSIDPPILHYGEKSLLDFEEFPIPEVPIYDWDNEYDERSYDEYRKAESAKFSHNLLNKFYFPIALTPAWEANGTPQIVLIAKNSIRVKGEWIQAVSNAAYYLGSKSRDEWRFIHEWPTQVFVNCKKKEYIENYNTRGPSSRIKSPLTHIDLLADPEDITKSNVDFRFKLYSNGWLLNQYQIKKVRAGSFEGDRGDQVTNARKKAIFDYLCNNN